MIATAEGACWVTAPFSRGKRSDTCIVNDFPADDCHYRPDLPDFRIAHCKVVLVEYGEIRQLTRFDRTGLVFHAQEPAVAASEKTQGLLPREMLSGVDLGAEGVDAGCREINVKPRIQRRDMNA